MVRTPNFHYRGHAFDPWSGNPVHCVVWQNKNKKEKKYMDYYDRLESNHRNTSFKKKKKLYLFGCARSQLWHGGASVSPEAHQDLSVEACGI